MKKTVAVFFGGRSPEHDVSIITGIQAIKALDSRKFDAFPVYIAPNGEWLVGEPLLNTDNYMLSYELINKLQSVTLDLGNNQGGRLLVKKKRLLGAMKSIHFDIALLAVHGIHGEDGQLPAVMEIANVAYTGMRHFGSTVLMNKLATKQILQTVNVPVLPSITIFRPTSGFVVEENTLKQVADQITFPACIKPCNLGSSIGVAKVNSIAELVTVLPDLFKYDYLAIVEPFVENLVEYNIAVGYVDNQLVTSSIEQPKCVKDLLDFKQKYASGEGSANKLNSSASGVKIPGSVNSGLLGLTRTLNPVLPSHVEDNIRMWAQTAFTAIHGSGFPRIDFLCNSKTGQLWLNEINPCPGSFGFYLWEASQGKTMVFTELLNTLLEEAEVLYNKCQLPVDPTPIDARLFPRKA